MPEADRETLRKASFEQGYQEGVKAGVEQSQAAAAKAAASLEAAVASLGRAVEEIDAFKPRLRREAERELVQLAFAIAKRVIRRELTVHPNVVVGIVRACLDEFGNQQPSAVRLHPQEQTLVTDYLRKRGIQNLRVVADPSISPGGAVFETGQGRLDAQIDSQIEEIQRGLADL